MVVANYGFCLFAADFVGALHLVRVRDGGGLTGLYTPAWVFYGKETRIAERSGVVFEGTEDQPWILMAINAVDGSIIDLIAGY
jgi:hypothetical protein